MFGVLHVTRRTAAEYVKIVYSIEQHRMKPLNLTPTAVKVQRDGACGMNLNIQ